MQSHSLRLPAPDTGSYPAHRDLYSYDDNNAYGQGDYPYPMDDPSYNMYSDNYGMDNTYQEPSYGYEQNYGYEQQYDQQNYSGYDNDTYTDAYGAQSSYDQSSYDRAERYLQGEYRAPQGTGTPGRKYDLPNLASNSMTIHELADMVRGVAAADCFSKIVDSLAEESSVPTAHTTLMLRNVPQKYSQWEFYQELLGQGFSGYFDFVYVPPNNFPRPEGASKAKNHNFPMSSKNVGYCWLNFITTEHMISFKRNFRYENLRQFNADTPMVIIPSTTQGWRENVLKVIRNCVLKKKASEADKLPLLFCRESHKSYPFPIPASSRNNSISGSNPHTPGFRSGPVAVSLANEFDDAMSHASHAHSGCSGGNKSGDSNQSGRSWVEQKSAVAHDPLEALAPNASGYDAISPEMQAQREAALKRQRFVYDHAPVMDQTSQSMYSQGMYDVQSNLPRNMGRYSRGTTQHYSAPNTENGSASGDRHIAAEISKLPTKASDFFTFHGLPDRRDDHITHIEGLRRRVLCTSKERAPVGSNTFLKQPPSAKPSGYMHMPYRVEPGKDGPKSPSSQAAARALKEAILGRKSESVEQIVEVNPVAKAFCDIDVEHFARERLQNKTKQVSSGSSDGSAASNRFNTELFSGATTPERMNSVPEIWSRANSSIEAMCSAIRAGAGENEEEDRSEGRLFSRANSLASVVLPNQQTSIMSLASVPEH